MIDWKQSYDALIEYIRTQYPLFDYHPDAWRVQHLISSLYTSLPATCRGTECPFAAICPVSDRLDILGTRCVLETMEIASRLSQYVKELDLSPLNYTDVQMVVDLVRLEILIWRIEQYLALSGMTVEEVTVTGRGKTVKTVPHPLISELRSLMEQKRRLYDDLVTSRRARLEREAREQKVANDLARILAQAQRAGIRTKGILPSHPHHSLPPPDPHPESQDTGPTDAPSEG